MNPEAGVYIYDFVGMMALPADPYRFNPILIDKTANDLPGGILAHFQRKRIHITDDSAIMRRNLNTILTQAGFTVSAEASNGEEALQAYRKFRPDLVTMDITMPVMDGLETVKRLIREDPEARIVVISAFDQRSMLFEAMENGAAAYLIKPITADKLLASVRQVLHRGPVENEPSTPSGSQESLGKEKDGPYFTVENRNGHFIIRLNDPEREGPYPELQTAVHGLMFVRPLNIAFDFGSAQHCYPELAVTIESMIGLIRGAGGQAAVIAGQETLAAMLRKIVSVPIAADGRDA